MIVYKLPDGNLMVPVRAESEGLLGDGMLEIAPQDPQYAEWLPFVVATATIKLKGGEGSGWFGPAKGGTHVGMKSADVKTYLVSKKICSTDIADKVAPQLEGINKKNLKDLSGITTAAPPGYRGGKGEWVNENDPSLTITGAYDYDTLTIHVHPDVLDGPIVLHELGHHASFSGIGSALERDIDQRVVTKSDKASAMSGTGAELAKYGLRKNSYTSGQEFVADAFCVWARGSDEQWSALSNLLSSRMVDMRDVTEVFGKR